MFINLFLSITCYSCRLERTPYHFLMHFYHFPLLLTFFLELLFSMQPFKQLLNIFVSFLFAFLVNFRLECTLFLLFYLFN